MMRTDREGNWRLQCGCTMVGGICVAKLRL